MFHQLCFLCTMSGLNLRKPVGPVVLDGQPTRPCFVDWKCTTLTVDVRFNHWNRNRTNYRIKETPWLRKTKPFWKATRDWVIKIEWIWLETFQIKSLTSIDTRACKFMHIALRDLWSFVSPEKKIYLCFFCSKLYSNSCYHDPGASTN